MQPTLKLIHHVHIQRCLKVHVRHGDKALEMDVLPAFEFLEASRYLHRQAPTNQPLSPNVFLSTDDPEVINSGVKWTGALAESGEDWRIDFTHNERANLPLYQLLEKFGGVNEMLNSLMNLDLALKCSGFVCALGSNWCSLIDELKSTSGGKAGQPYVNLGFGHHGSEYYYP